MNGGILYNYTNDPVFVDIESTNQTVQTITQSTLNTYEIVSICMMAATIVMTFCGVGVCWWQLKTAFVHSI